MPALLVLRLADYLPGDFGPRVFEDFCVPASSGPLVGEQAFPAQFPPSSQEQHEACEQFSDLSVLPGCCKFRNLGS